jgi:uncharacterized protein YecT (DUF1311 family)
MRQTDGEPGTGPARFDQVGSTLEQIFGPAAETAPAPVSPRALPVLVASSSKRRGRRVAFGLVLASAATAAGVAMGITVFDRDDRALSPPATRSATVAPAVKAVPPAPQPTVAVANVAVAPIIAASPEPMSEAAREEVVTREVPPRVRKVPGDNVAAASVVSRRGACEGQRGDSFACVVERLDTADRELVEAYASAVDAGVPRPELVRINRRWNRARDRARDDPAGAVRSYERLADELWSARRQELGDDE